MTLNPFEPTSAHAVRLGLSQPKNGELQLESAVSSVIVWRCVIDINAVLSGRLARQGKAYAVKRNSKALDEHRQSDVADGS